jgi:hypothetical protein
MRLVNEDN